MTSQIYKATTRRHSTSPYAEDREQDEGYDGDNGGLSTAFEEEYQRPRRTFERMQEQQAQRQILRDNNNYQNTVRNNTMAPSDAARKRSKVVELERQVAELKDQKEASEPETEDIECKKPARRDIDPLVLLKEVKTVMRTIVWRTVKFVPEGAEKKVALKVFDAIDPSFTEGWTREEWASEKKNQYTVLQASNAVRQYVVQRLEVVLKEFMDKNEGKLPTFQQMEACYERTVGNDVGLGIFFEWYWDKYLPKSTGNAWDWDESVRYWETISQAFIKDQDGMCHMSVSTEAFAILAYENVRDKLIHTAAKEKETKKTVVYKKKITREDEEDPDIFYTSDTKFCAKFSSSSGGQQRHGNWSKEGKMRFKELRDIIKEARKLKRCRTLESKTLKSLRQKHRIPDGFSTHEDWMNSKRRRGRKRPLDPADIVDTLDDEEL